MNGFDKICMGLAMCLAVLLLVLGAIGLFFGCSANFTLPPVLGVIPLLVGWGIFVAVRFTWKAAPSRGTRRHR